MRDLEEKIAGVEIAPSHICLGTAMYGSAIPLDESLRMLDAYHEEGGNFLDTASCFADWIPGTSGASEKAIGQWLKMTGARKQTIIGTKGGHPIFSAMETSRLSAKALENDLNQSLERLGTDYIDIYWIHQDDPSIPVGEIIDALEAFRSSGRIRAFGASNLTLSRLNDSRHYAAANGLVGFSASQIGWSLAELKNQNITNPSRVYMDEAMFDFHRQSGLPVVAYSSQALGFFYKWAAKKGGDKEKSVDPFGVGRYENEENFTRYSRSVELAGLHACTPNDIALSYICSQNFPAFPIVGCRTQEQLIASYRGVQVSLSSAEISFLALGSPLKKSNLINRFLQKLIR